MNTDPSKNDLFLNHFPIPIASSYKSIESIKGWEGKSRCALLFYEFGLRYFTLLSSSQYLYRTKELNNPYLDKLLLYFLQVGEKTLGLMQHVLFSILKTHKGQRDQFYMKEMYDWYWDTSYSPHRQREGIGKAFGELIKIRNDITHYKIIPQDESEWEKFNDLVISLLYESLGSLTFLQNYKLVKVDRIIDNIMICKDFTGINPVPDPLEVEIQEGQGIPKFGWLCISNVQPDYLQVHPLIVFMQSAQENKESLVFIDNFGPRDAVYIHPRFGSIPLVNVIEDLLQYVRDFLEERLGQIIEYNKLTWENFKEASKLITIRKTALLQAKYNSKLFLQRQLLIDEYNRFISSEKTALILIGNSGIGKSNFVASIINKYVEDENTAVFAYDGASIYSGESLIQMLNNELKPLFRRSGLTTGFFLDDLSHRFDMSSKKVIIIIDGINENSNPRDLLFNINQFVIDYGRYPWLKVVITSRPQAWRLIKRKIKLEDTFYYFPKSSIDPWFEITPFTWKELPLVFNKYVKGYKLQNQYDGLAPEVKVNLRIPLFLYLVSKTWEGREIPPKISEFKIYEEYINILVRQGVLEAMDIDFLESELIPLFINKGDFRSSLSRKELYTLYTSNGRPIIELIESKDYVGDLPINSSFNRLVDAGLLEQKGEPRDYEVIFKFERFFDYFIGKGIYNLVREKHNLESSYRLVMQKILLQPWLFGGVKNALIMELNFQNYDLIDRLIYTEEEILRDLIVVSIEEFGQDEPINAKNLLAYLLSSSKRKSIFSRKPSIRQSTEVTIARKGIIEAAYRVDALDIIEQGVFDRNRSVRFSSIQQIWRFWREKDRELGFVALEKLLSKSTRNIFISINGIVAVVALSLLILFENSTDVEITSRLRRIWKPVIQRFFIAKPTNNKLWRNTRKRIRRFLLNFSTFTIFRLVRSTEDVGYWINLKEISDFFNLTPSEKSSCRRVLSYIETDFGDLVEIYDDIISIAKIPNVFTWFLLVAVFMPHCIKTPSKVIDILQKFFFNLVSLPSAPPAIVLPKDLFEYGIDPQLYVQHPEWLEIYGSMYKMFLEKHESKFTSRITSYQYLMGGFYLNKYYELNLTVTSAFQKRYLEYVLKSSNCELIKSYTRSFAGSAVVHLPTRIAMTALLPIVDFWKDRNSEDIHEWKDIEDILVEAFSIIRNFKPLDVDDFMLENEFPDVLQQRVKSSQIEQLGNVLALGGSKFVNRAFLANPSPERRKAVKQFFNDALDAPKRNVWFQRFIELIIEMVYGENIFRIHPEATRSE